MAVEPGMKIRRYKDLVILYDLDFNDRQTIVRQRIYKTEDGTIQTPVTGMLQAREIPTDRKAPKRAFDPRRAIACFENPENETGRSELTVFVPYRPNTIDLRTHLQEIKTFPGVKSASYKGEVHALSIKPMFAPQAP